MKTSNKLLLAFLLLIFASITFAVFYVRAKATTKKDIQGNGNKISLIIKTEKFNGVNILGDVKAFITQGAVSEVKLKGDENILPLVETKVDNGVLFIKADQLDGKIEAYISVDSLIFIGLGKGSIVETTGKLNGETLSIESESGGLGNLQLDYKQLKGVTSSGAILTLAGNISDMKMKSSSGSTVRSSDLETKNAAVDGRSGAIIDVNVSENLAIKLSSGSVLNYKGSPVMKEVDVTSGGIINKVE